MLDGVRAGAAFTAGIYGRRFVFRPYCSDQLAWGVASSEEEGVSGAVRAIKGHFYVAPPALPLHLPFLPLHKLSSSPHFSSLLSLQQEDSCVWEAVVFLPPLFKPPSPASGPLLQIPALCVFYSCC